MEVESFMWTIVIINGFLKLFILYQCLTCLNWCYFFVYALLKKAMCLCMSLVRVLLVNVSLAFVSLVCAAFVNVGDWMVVSVSFSHLISSGIVDPAHSCCSDDIFDDIDGSFNELNNKVSHLVLCKTIIIIIYWPEWQLFNVAGYLIEYRRRWPIITASPWRQYSK